MFIIIPQPTLLQIIFKIIHNFQVNVKSIKNADDNFKSNSEAFYGLKVRIDV